MDRSTRASDAAPPPSDDPAGADAPGRPADTPRDMAAAAAGRPADTPPSDSETPADTAASAAAEEENTTGLTGAPDPGTDTRPTSRPPGTGRNGRRPAASRAGWPGSARSTRPWSRPASGPPPPGRGGSSRSLLAAYVVIIALSRIRVVVIPLAIALLLAALLQPLAAVLAKRGVPPALATAITLLSPASSGSGC